MSSPASCKKLRRHLALSISISVILLPAVSLAQEKNELSGVFGRTFITGEAVPDAKFFDNLVRFGKGATAEVSYSRQFYRYRHAAFFLEVPVSMNPDEDLSFGLNAVPKDYRACFVTPSLRTKLLADKAVFPWVSVGAGYAYFSPSSSLIFGGPTPANTSKSTGAFQAGVGFDVALRHHFRLIAEGRDYYTGAPDLVADTGRRHQHNRFLGVGIAWGF